MVIFQQSTWAEKNWSIADVMDAIEYVESHGKSNADIYPFHREDYHRNEDRKSRGIFGVTDWAQKELVRVGKLDKVYAFDGSNVEVEKDIACNYLIHMMELYRCKSDKPADWVEAAGWYHAGDNKQERKIYRLKIRNALERAKTRNQL